MAIDWARQKKIKCDKNNISKFNLKIFLFILYICYIEQISEVSS